MAGLDWTQADLDKLRAAAASGVRVVEYDGPPKRRIEYHSLEEMRGLLAEMARVVTAAPTYSYARMNKGV